MAHFMKIQIASDLHLEYLRHDHPDHRIVEHTDADVLVLAGDIAHIRDGAIPFEDWPVPVVYVHGNHEFYGDEYLAAAGRLSDAYPSNIHYLENRETVLSGVRFLGCCLWTDYALDGNLRQSMANAWELMPDHDKIKYADSRFEPSHALQLHQESRAWLEQKLEQPFAGKTVVVSHHAPHPNSVHSDYRSHPGNPGFVSDLTPLMGKAVLWIHGHTHSSFRYVVNGTEVVANPCGYPANKSVADPMQLRFENPAFDSGLVIEI